MSTIEERVNAGAMWLDARVPGWVDRIDLDLFDFGMCDKCIIGQTFGHYMRWLCDEYLAGSIKTLADVAALGFTADELADTTIRRDEYFELSVAWKALILRRRDEARAQACVDAFEPLATATLALQDTAREVFGADGDLELAANWEVG